MPLHEFKTQVLLLHSEQSTLDNLSSGFSDRYTVHCATSGSEALNTLVETPINVIVSAQDLPGMSGLEALREARKRSPDTLGILLAGNADEGLEALVGEKEVFQVVRGNVTGDMISKLVDEATQQMRLMALAESANDTAANVDEPNEHIVMETSETGATIISDGTGQLPKLDPEKVSAATAVGSRAVDVLVLTKDQEFLSTIKDSSRGMHTIHYATTLAQADKTIRKFRIGVAIVDAAMVGDKVEQLTQHLRKGSARLVSIVAGRRDDGEMLMDLINRGKVYRFLLKPVSPGRARLAVEASVKHHLEAPDSAFKAKGTDAAPQPAVKATPKAEIKTKPKAAVEAKPKAAKQAKKGKKGKKGKEADAQKPAVRVDPPLGTVSITDNNTSAEERLDSAFGEEDASFTETVTGLISSVGKKFSSVDDKKPAQSPSVEPVAASGGGSLLRDPKILGAGAAAAVIISGALFWVFGGSEEPAPIKEAPVVSAPTITQADEEFSPPAVSDESREIGPLVEEARLARGAGQIFNPAGSNAIELFASAANMDPDNSQLAAEFDAVISEALSMAETALLEARLDDAQAALQRISAFDPGNTRLPFLTAQLSQMQLRGHIVDARTAIREERFEDAANSIAAAESLSVSDNPEVDEVIAELDAARNAQQADEVLALANARLEEGDLLNPANDNARYYYELVLSNDPQNTAARQGLGVIANKLVLQARSEIDNNNFDSAQGLLNDARAVDPENAEVTAAAGALVSAQDALAKQQRRAEAARLAEIDRQAAEARAEAERQAAVQRAAAEARAEAERQAAAERAAADVAAAEKMTDSVVDETLTGGAVSASMEPAEAGEAGSTDSDPPSSTQANVAMTAGASQGTVASTTAGAQPPPQAAAQSTPSSEPTRMAFSSLNRIKYVAPKYPRSAQRRDLSGWVDIAFTVGIDGTAKDVAVRNSEPGDTFDSAAIKAVEKWEFEPVYENGVLVEKRSGVRMMFALE